MPQKGCKVTTKTRTKIVGVACDSFKQLCEKGKLKLQLAGQIHIALEDGTLVEDDEFFSTVPQHSLFIFYNQHEQIISGVDLILNALKHVNTTFLSVGAEAAQVLVEKAQELSMLLDNAGSAGSTTGNTRDTDPDWFAGLETNARSKEEYMNKKAQERIKGYLYKCQDDVRKSETYVTDPKARKVLTDCIAEFKVRLAADGYFGCYFDRRCVVNGSDSVDSTSKLKKRLKMADDLAICKQECFCDSGGRFECEGMWKMNYCSYDRSHVINPYHNRESRIVFSTWNLDHRIEKSRTIVPGLLLAAKKTSGVLNLNVAYFYGLLFTRANLRLVHIVCHDKKSHDIAIDLNSIHGRCDH